MNLFRAITTSVWMIQEDTAMKLMPLVNNFLAGKPVDFKAFMSPESAYGVKPSAKAEKGVYVIPLKSIITKYDFCGEMGMITFQELLNQLRMDDSVGAAVLDFDCPGGEASYMPHVMKAVRDFRAEKPILSFVCGVCASAAYGLASQTDKIYVSHSNDIVGSVGTMYSLMRPNPENKTSEWIYESIYATKSTMKNHDFEEAFRGRPEALRKNLLDPFNESFLQEVKLGRPELHEDVFTGISMVAGQADKFKLIDGFKTLGEVVQEAYSLIK